MDMKKFDEMTREMIDERVSKAMECMKHSPKCEMIYNAMCKMGYVKEMQNFKSVVFLTYMLKPDVKEDEIMRSFHDIAQRSRKSA